EMRIVEAAARVLLEIAAAGNELRAGDAPQLRETAGVIVVGVAVEQKADVRNLEAEALDIRANHRHRLLESAVEEEVSLGGGDEVRRDVRRADVVDVAGAPERLHGL